MSSPSAAGAGPGASRARPDFERIALLLQGGGVLAAIAGGGPEVLRHCPYDLWRQEPQEHGRAGPRVGKAER